MLFRSHFINSTSGSRSSDVEFIKCIHCKTATPLSNRVEAALLDEEFPDVDQRGFIESDGYFVYFNSVIEGRVRLL